MVLSWDMEQRIGGKMVNSLYSDEPYSEDYYIYYYDNNYNKVTAISKIDESNLKKLEADMQIDYIKMTKQSYIDYKLKEIKEKVIYTKDENKRENAYKDTYYYFADLLVILFITDFIFKKRRIQ